MQTDTADALNSKQKRQHWLNKNQINKKQIGKFKYIFQKNPSKTKEEEKRITDTIEVKSTSKGN